MPAATVLLIGDSPSVLVAIVSDSLTNVWSEFLVADVASSQPEGPSRLIARTDPLVPQGSVAESGNECEKSHPTLIRFRQAWQFVI